MVAIKTPFSDFLYLISLLHLPLELIEAIELLEPLDSLEPLEPTEHLKLKHLLLLIMYRIIYKNPSLF